MGTLDEHHQRTVALIEHLLDTGGLTLHGLLYLLYNTQSTDDIKRLAEISMTRPCKLRRQGEEGE